MRELRLHHPRSAERVSANDNAGKHKISTADSFNTTTYLVETSRKHHFVKLHRCRDERVAATPLSRNQRASHRSKGGIESLPLLRRKRLAASPLDRPA